VKSPRFKYHDPTTVHEVLGLLASHRDEARLFAGGQSLMPLLNFRLARPAHLVDLNRIDQLAAISSNATGLTIGAMVRQRALERSDVALRQAPLLGQALQLVGCPAIRNRGTLGGSLAHADPAAELPAVMVALDATLMLYSSRGRRQVDARDFFVGPLRTLLEADELLTEIHVPGLDENTGSSINEVAIRVGDFALGGVATTLTLGSDERISSVRIVCFGVDDRPTRQVEAENSLLGSRPTAQAFATAAAAVVSHVRPADDIHASAGYRRRLAGTLTARALTAALASTTELHP
jgi:carbon-monoxide dehydrogenase medium subunit